MRIVRKLSGTLVFAVAFAVIITAGCTSNSSAAGGAAVPAGSSKGGVFQPFPAGMSTTDGQPLSLERFKGKILLVDFWATWCPPCRAEVPHLVAAYDKYKAKGFEIVGISFDKDRSALDNYLSANKMTWPQYFDGLGWNNKVGKTYGIRSIPSMVLLDGDGKVVSTNLRNGGLERELEKLLPNR